MSKLRNVLIVLAAVMALGISLTATASATTASTSNCPSGQCYEEAAEWVPGTTITTSGGSGSGNGSGGGSSAAIVKETPVSKLKEVKKSYEKKYHVVVGSYQNPHGYEGTSPCVDPTKVKMFHFHAGEYVKTTNHLREPVPPEKWHAGETICGGKEVKINGKWWFVGTQFVCSNVKTWIPIKKNKIRKPKREYVQFPTMEKFYKIAMKRLEIKSTSQGGSGSGSGEGGSASFETPGHYQCKPGGVLNGNKCKYCPPPSCEPSCSPCHEEEKEPPCECTPPPPCGEVEFFGEYEFEENHVNEGPTEYWKYINAPKGDQLTVYFETEHGSFSPEVVQVASFGSETTKFQSYWTAPSHPGHYAVWVRVVDHTCEKTYESTKQFVTVLPWELEEPPR